MRQAWVLSSEALRERMVQPAQVAPTEPEAGMPPYMESFLAHLRLLVGVPFEYLVPDARLLPVESIRFFYLDRSWTDRLVDGAVAVGKIGSRELAHYQAHAPEVSQQLDQTERVVRALQRGKVSFLTARDGLLGQTAPAEVITGFLLRSALVSGWPHMDVRAYDKQIKEPFDAADPESLAHQLKTLRLERLSPAVLLALFQGIPKLVILEEPHHGLQFGVVESGGGFHMDLRTADGHQIMNGNIPENIVVPVRQANTRVVAVAELRKRLAAARATHPQMPVVDASANFAVEVLDPPWRQRFEGIRDNAEGGGGGSGRFVASRLVAVRITDPATLSVIKEIIE
jgi:hypothetical protein